MASLTELTERIEQVEEGDEVVWNGRNEPQPVTEVTETHFVVDSDEGGRFKFHKTGLYPKLTNLNSGNDWYVEEFEIADAAE